MTYPERLLDHYRAPRHRGPLPDATHQGHARNVLCGDEVTIRLRVATDRIVAAAFEGVGCVYCIAASSLLCGHVEGTTPQEAEAIDAGAVTGWLEVTVPAGRRDCAGLPLLALREALA